MLCETVNTNEKQKELPAANSIQLCQRFLMAFLFFLPPGEQSFDTEPRISHHSDK